MQFMFQHQIFTKQRGGLGEQVKITNLFKYVIWLPWQQSLFKVDFSGSLLLLVLSFFSCEYANLILLNKLMEG